MRRDFVIGYDPGGDNAHGVAILEVRKVKARWNPISLQIKVAHSLQDAVDWVEKNCQGGRIMAAGIDTLTEWSSSNGGWRLADLWLRDTYPLIIKSIVSPNSIYGAMAINGAGFLTRFESRFRSDCTMITEAHPKVCFYAMTNQKHDWVNQKSNMTTWLVKELGVEIPIEDSDDHYFDAGIALLAALRGLNHDWINDLHAIPNEAYRIRFTLQTHYWWPE